MSLTRREFVHGAAVALAAPGASAAITGQTDALRAPAHAWRSDPARWAAMPAELDADAWDLVVVGAGLSGLAAAWWFRENAGRPVRVLLLDALDEVGGHARRNMFTSRSGQRLIGYGGSQSLDGPSLFSPAALALLDGVAVPWRRFEREWFDRDWAQRHGVQGHALHFDSRHWPAGHTVVQGKGWLGRVPLAPADRAEWRALLEARRDVLPGLRTPAERRDALIGMTYRDFLTRHWGMPAAVVRIFQKQTQAYFGAGIDAVSALDAHAAGLPGFQGLALGEGVDARCAPSAQLLATGQDEYIYHFPDGNHGVARALLRALIPAALPGSSVESLVDDDLNAAALDAPGQPVCVRLRATAVYAGHRDGHGAGPVCVRYLDAQGRLREARAPQAVMAGWSRTIADLCPELPEAQRAELRDQVKTPLVYANVLLANWRAFARLGVRSIRPVDGFWDEASLDFPVRLASHQPPASPDEPILLHLAKIVMPPPETPPLAPREQMQRGRALLDGWDFDHFERETRLLLDGALGAYGFDWRRDAEALTVNRWAHGYAYEYMRPWDAYWPDGPLPCERARLPFGGIAIAGSDAGAYAYAHSAIDQAARAVQELLPQARLPVFATRPGPWVASGA